MVPTSLSEKWRRNLWPVVNVKGKLIFSDTYTTANPGSMNLHNSEFILVTNTLRPEGAENMSLGFQVPDLFFLKQNCIRNLKIDSKQSIPDPPQ